MIKEHILDIATSEFAILGYSALSMNNLAKKLEINKATIYYHFKDKKSLYNEVILSLIQLNKDEREAIANGTLEPKEKFKQYIKSLIHTMGDNPNIIPLTLREMAGFDIGIESNISNNIENDIICMKKIVLQLNLKEKYKSIDFYESKLNNCIKSKGITDFNAQDGNQWNREDIQPQLKDCHLRIKNGENEFENVEKES